MKDFITAHWAEFYPKEMKIMTDELATNGQAEVARRLHASSEVVSTLEKAAKENQFSKAINDSKDYIPNSLLLDGHNPMLMLHKALSIGLHDGNDEKCLEIAHSIRIVLQDLSQRIKDALREERELKKALDIIAKFNQSS